MFKRALVLDDPPRETFFLWGPRQVGKTTLLRQTYPHAVRLDMLRSDEFSRYTSAPHLLRTEVAADPSLRLILIDEIQKVPALLDEVHWLIENRGLVFGLCGSSARKLRRGHANLLGGRAVRFELFGLVSKELGSELDLGRLLNRGYLPRHFASSEPTRLLRSYVGDYLKEEVAAEGLVRNLPAFSQFLATAALSDTELVNYSTFARECGVSSHTVQEYFQILVDTLLGRFVPAFTKRPKRRTIGSPKFYFADVGVVNFLAKRGALAPRSELFGKAFENWVCHELAAQAHYSGSFHEITHWRLTTGIEVDFVLDDMRVAIEAKATHQVTGDHLKGLRVLAAEHSELGAKVVVCLEPKARRTDDGIDILPAATFAERLWAGRIFDSRLG
ncbi:MAG: ATP-binding protein [Deltaproteobacteria bacterium]|nr:ATP-binding protein [Deltaproteobacteria bacterium]